LLEIEGYEKRSFLLGVVRALDVIWMDHSVNKLKLERQRREAAAKKKNKARK